MKKLKYITVISLSLLLGACNNHINNIQKSSTSTTTNNQPIMSDKMPRVIQKEYSATIYDFTILTAQSITQEEISNKINNFLDETKKIEYDLFLNNLEKIGKINKNSKVNVITLIDSQFDIDTSPKGYLKESEKEDKLLLKESGIGVVVKIMANPDTNRVGIIASSSKGAELDIKNLDNNTTSYKNEINLNRLYPIAIYKEDSNKYRVLFIEVSESGSVKTLSLK